MVARLTFRICGAIAAASVLSQALALFLFGQPTICECGSVKLWEGVVLSTGNSQHISDWYTFSHVVHGIIFYAALAWLVPGIPVRLRLLIALGVEISWEVIENTPIVIQHYRQQALAVGYNGDSILNSVMDAIFMIIGFLLTWRYAWWVSVGLALALELFTLYMIRDNLTLNVVNLIHVFPSIATWQAQ